MSGSCLGNVLKLSTFGESHGNSIGGVLSGMPSNIHITESFIQAFLNERKPGQNSYVSPRKEDDTIIIQSGLLNNLTLGTPIAFLVQNNNQNSKDYKNVENIYRPGHADYTFHKKFGIYDHRGGGRASARETISRVIAGAIASKLLPKQTKVIGRVKQIYNIKAPDDFISDTELNINNFYCSCNQTVAKWQNLIKNAIKSGDSLGAICEITIKNPPIGLGEPVFDKLDAELAKSIMSIPAVKGVEIGNGFDFVNLKGSQSRDEMEYKDNKILYKTNKSGGILGGISNGEDIIIKYVVKPTSSIISPANTIDANNNNIQNLSVKGRHDPCVGIRSIPIAKAMVNFILADFLLLQKRNNI